MSIWNAARVRFDRVGAPIEGLEQLVTTAQAIGWKFGGRGETVDPEAGRTGVGGDAERFVVQSQEAGVLSRDRGAISLVHDRTEHDRVGDGVGILAES